MSDANADQIERIIFEACRETRNMTKNEDRALVVYEAARRIAALPITAETVRRVLSAHNTEKHADPGFYSDNTTMTYREFCEAIAQRANQGEK